MNFREREYRRQAAFRRTSATISPIGRAPIDKEGGQYPYTLLPERVWKSLELEPTREMSSS